MNRYLLLLTLFIGVTFASQAVLLEYQSEELDIIDHPDHHPQTPIYFVPLPLFIPKNLKDYLTVTVTARTSVIVCIQELLQLQSGLSSCNREGYLNFTIINGTGVPPTFTEQTSEQLIEGGGSRFFFDLPSTNFYDWTYKTLEAVRPFRLETIYYISFYFVWYGPNSVNTSTFSISITGNLCNGEDEWGPLCEAQNKYKHLKTKEPLKGEQVAPNSYEYYYLDQLDPLDPEQQYGDLTATLTRADDGNTTIPIGFYYKRNAFPIWEENKESWDAHLFNESSYQLVIVSPPKSFKYLTFAVANFDDKAFSYAIEIDIQICKAGLVGNNCSFGLFEVNLNVTQDNNIVNETWTKKLDNDGFAYFHFSSPDPIVVGAGGEKEGETPNIYLGAGFVPSPNSYLLANENQTEPVHLLHASFGAASFGHDVLTMTDDIDWYIAVNASSEYSLWVNYQCAVNCSGKGYCAESTGICVCDDGYEKFDCSDKSFPLVWIILIAIGGAILLAIAIGVPISCYLKNKKKSGYERV